MIKFPGELFSTPPFEGSYSGGGVIHEGSDFSNIVFSLLTERNSFQTVAKLSFLGQRMRPTVYTMSSLESYSREEVIFFMSVPRGGSQLIGGVIQRNTAEQNISFLAGLVFCQELPWLRTVVLLCSLQCSA